MTETFRKLNFKAQRPILVLHAPASFAPEMSAMRGETEVHVSPKKGTRYSFVVAFAEMRADLEKTGREVMGFLGDDPVCWFVYPKKTSKKYTSDLSRDVLWEALAVLGIRPVRQIAVDEDWSALRFRAGK